jgi:ATP-dependent exoDNAse (exonuclease V) alpha subunit
VPLLGDDAGVDEPHRWRSRTGARVPVALQERRYSTVGHLALEKRIVQRALTGRATGRGIAAAETTSAVLARRPQLSDEQREMVRRLTGDGEAVAVVVGSAGSGKTTALAAAHAAWEACGYPVRGAAVARRAARELQDGSGIQTTSVAARWAHSKRATRCPTGACSWSMGSPAHDKAPGSAHRSR